jgi:hypothetical protein
MTCRCPACDQVLLIDQHVTPTTILCCDRCDRGFKAKDSLCEHCSGHNPFARRDAVVYECHSCGALQSDPSAAMAV